MLTESYAVSLDDGTLLECTIGDAFDAAAQKHAEREALIVRHQNLRLTYRALHEEVERCARGLLAMGVEPGERVGILAPNCAEWVVVQFATAKIGAILV